MILKAFRVQNYRSVIDSGWIDLREITIVVGKKESGKTSLLKALWKFNPCIDEPFDANDEWPRGHRQELSSDKPVITLRFTFTSDELKEISGIGPSTGHITGVVIQRNYNGKYRYDFLPHNPEKQEKLNPLTVALERLTVGCKGILNSLFPKNNPGTLTAGPAKESKAAAITEISDEELIGNLPYKKSVELASRLLPTFIYMDDNSVFKGSIQLNQLKQNRDSSQLTEEDCTSLIAFEMAGLDLDKEVSKGELADKEQRMLDMYDASGQINEKIALRWLDKRYEIQFQADGQYLITFVKDTETNTLTPLEECSKGIQWSFSFDMNVVHLTGRELSNVVIMLDEPGENLHPAEQQELVEQISENAHDNQLIYTTHLPFIIDFSHPENIYIAEDNVKEGTKVSNCRATEDEASRRTLQESLGLSGSPSLLANQFNLIVDDVTDYWLLTSFSQLFLKDGKEWLDEQITITPAGSNMAFLGNLLHDQQQNSVFLFNTISDENDPDMQLMNTLFDKDNNIISLSKMFCYEHSCSPEDFLPEAYYLEKVNMVYKMRLNGTPLTIEVDVPKSILERVKESLANRGIDNFNRIRVARRVLQDLEIQPSSEIFSLMTDRLAQVIHTINSQVKRMREIANYDADAPQVITCYVPAVDGEEGEKEEAGR